MPVTRSRPREAFGFTAQPLSGGENPMLSQDMQQMVNRAGLAPFAPYIDPYRTLALAQQMRDQEQGLQQADLESQFMESIKADPQTGMQRFLAQNPVALDSPRIRTYALTQQKLRGRQSDDGYAEDLANEGAEYLEGYQRDVDAGESPINAFAKRRSEILKNKEKAPKQTDDRIALTQDHRGQIFAAVDEMTKEPTPEERIQAYNEANGTAFTVQSGAPEQAYVQGWTLARKNKEKALRSLATNLYISGMKLPAALEKFVDKSATDDGFDAALGSRLNQQVAQPVAPATATPPPSTTASPKIRYVRDANGRMVIAP